MSTFEELVRSKTDVLHFDENDKTIVVVCKTTEETFAYAIEAVLMAALEFHGYWLSNTSTMTETETKIVLTKQK